MLRELPLDHSQIHLGLESIHEFPVFYSARDYEKRTGRIAPPFDHNKPVKLWFDPDADGKVDSGTVEYTIVKYDIQTGLVQIDVDNHVPLGTMRLSLAWAQQVNIPPNGVTHGDTVQCLEVPLRRIAVPIVYRNSRLELDHAVIPENPHERIVRDLGNVMDELTAMRTEIKERLEQLLKQDGKRDDGESKKKGKPVSVSDSAPQS